MNFKDIHIGFLINQRVTESGIDISRICNFMKCTEKEVNEMYSQKSLCTYLLLRWCKLLHYDFFRLYSQHLILYAPPAAYNKDTKTSILPRFRKNIYTKEVIDFILELVGSGEKTIYQIIDEYGIPKTTLYKWIKKYKETDR
ncbi:uroporphyrinogen-III decarboxylase [Chryseobacterium defluvii]|uniref:Uroporphyrinogen-III decarboxylase n=1 Tax=Chryseobacterium defluvii TaxID=160396 RepID=A0A840K6I5_9FLAO|nr:helix-turn-helix domain-containing protein [Chryseobacterium defluvii]MBB4804836.1 uroporphyrinogen-III decarboxylase [Chryseobacterium defluvii]